MIKITGRSPGLMKPQKQPSWFAPQDRKRQHDIGGARDERVDPAAVEARHEAQEHADHDGDPRGEERHRQRGAGPVGDPHEEVPARIVHTEQVSGRRLFYLLPRLRIELVRPPSRCGGEPIAVERIQIDLVRLVPGPARDERREDRHQDHDPDDHEAGEGEPILAEVPPEDLPGAPADDGGRGLGRRRGGFQVGALEPFALFRLGYVGVRVGSTHAREPILERLPGTRNPATPEGTLSQRL
jgi:hypothetical protein